MSSTPLELLRSSSSSSSSSVASSPTSAGPSDTHTTDNVIFELTVNGSHYNFTWDLKASHQYYLHLDSTGIAAAEAQRYQGKLELVFSWETFDLLQRKMPRSGRGLRVDVGSSSVYLGPLSGQRTASALFVTADDLRCGVAVLSVVRFSPICERAPESSEVLLCDHIVDILANDECLGSLTCDSVQNRVSLFPFYATAMANYGKSKPFTKFVKKFHLVHNRWVVFSYDFDDITVFGSAPPGGSSLRMTTRELFASRRYLENDVAREVIRRKACVELVEQYNERNRWCPLERVLADLALSRSYKTLREMQFDKQLAFFAESKRWAVLFHPLHRISMAGGMPTEPAFFVPVEEKSAVKERSA